MLIVACLLHVVIGIRSCGMPAPGDPRVGTVRCLLYQVLMLLAAIYDYDEIYRH